MIELQRFSRADNSPAFRGYLHVKYEVFVEEQGWPLGADRDNQLVVEDEVDAKSCFVLATDEDGREVGTVRGTLLSEAFPHKAYLEHHLQRSGIDLEISRLATVNALAVVPRLRGRRMPIAGRDRPITVGKALMCEIVDWCREQGALAVIFTTMRGVPAIFFEHLGAYVMDPFFRVQSLDFDLINMALLVTDPDRFSEKQSPLLDSCPRRPLSDAERASKSYCQDRQAEILQGESIEQFVQRD